MRVSRTVRIVIAGVVLAGVLAVVAGLIWTNMPSHRLGRYWRRGNAALAAGRYREAEIDFQNVLAISASVPAYDALARTELQLGNLPNAYQALKHALTLAPNDLEAHLQLGELLLRDRRYADGIREAQFVLSKDPGNARAHTLLSEGDAGLGNLTDAVRQAEQAVEQSPSAHGLVVLGTLYAIRGNATGAEQAYTRGIAAAPNDPEPRLALAVLLERENRLADAERTLVEGTHAVPDDMNLAIALGDLYAARRQFDQATAEYHTAERLAHGSSTPALRGVAVLMAQGELDQAQKAATALTTTFPDDPLVYLAAGRINLQKGDAATAISQLQRVIQAQPNSPVVRDLLGRAYYAHKDTALAKEQFLEALKLDPHMTDAGAALATLEVQTGNPQGALRDLQQLVAASPRDAGMLVLLADFYTSRRDFPNAIATYQRAVAVLPRNPEVHLRLAAAYRFAGRPADAIREYEATLALQPGRLDALTQESAIYVGQHQAATAIDRVQAAIAKSPKNVGLYALLGTIYQASGNNSKAEEAFYKAISTDQNAAAPYIMLAGLYASEGAYEMAAGKYNEEIQRNPKFLPPYVILGNLYDQQGDYAQAQSWYQKALAIAPTFAPAANDLAYSYADHGGDLDQALTLAQTARRGMPNDPHTADTLGWVYYKKGNAKDAIPLLQESVRGQPGDPTVHYHLGLAYNLAGDHAAAKRELTLALGLHQKFAGADDARKVLASLGG